MERADRFARLDALWPGSSALLRPHLLALEPRGEDRLTVETRLLPDGDTPSAAVVRADVAGVSPRPPPELFVVDAAGVAPAPAAPLARLALALQRCLPTPSPHDVVTLFGFLACGDPLVRKLELERVLRGAPAADASSLREVWHAPKRTGDHLVFFAVVNRAVTRVDVDLAGGAVTGAPLL